MASEIDMVGKMFTEKFEETEISKIKDKNYADKIKKVDFVNNNVSNNMHSARKIISPEIIYSYRRKREIIFDNTDIFSDPCWDMLLTLFVSHLNKKMECISSVCISSNVPVTTALRWLKILERQDLVARCNDPRDSRRRFIALTAGGVSKMYAALNIDLFDKSNK